MFMLFDFQGYSAVEDTSQNNQITKRINMSTVFIFNDTFKKIHSYMEKTIYRFTMEMKSCISQLPRVAICSSWPVDKRVQSNLMV